MTSALKECPEEKLTITPETKISALLNAYPDLEPVLIEMAPAFEKLKNPILRKTIARVANLRQAAELGKIPLGTLINRLRRSAGQNEWQESGGDTAAGESGTPAWVTSGQIHITLDARPMLEAGEHPVNRVMQELPELQDNQLYVLIAPFVPAPLIDMAKTKGFKTWTREEAPNLVKTYFSK